MPRGFKDLDFMFPEVEAIAVMEINVGALHTGVSAHANLREGRKAELSGAGNVIRVDMSIEDELELEIGLFEEFEVSFDLFNDRIYDDGFASFGVSQDIGISV